MATSYPGSLDAFDTIASDKKTSDSVGGRTHRQMHNDLGDSIEAVQAELGTDPAGSYSTVKARLDALVAYAAKTSAYTATVADHTLNVTSGTFTLDLPAASTCTGQSLRVKNSGTGVVTLDGNSSETVEGVATFPLGEHSYVEITSTGSAWILTAGVPDTGWRNVSAGLLTDNGYTTVYELILRRIGRHVHMNVVSLARGSSGSGATALYAAPAGFMPTGTSATYGATYSAKGLYVLPGTGDVAINSPGTSEGFSVTFPTDDAWPTSLPGTAV